MKYPVQHVSKCKTWGKGSGHRFCIRTVLVSSILWRILCFIKPSWTKDISTHTLHHVIRISRLDSLLQINMNTFHTPYIYWIFCLFFFFFLVNLDMLSEISSMYLTHLRATWHHRLNLYGALHSSFWNDPCILFVTRSRVITQCFMV